MISPFQKLIAKQLASKHSDIKLELSEFLYHLEMFSVFAIRNCAHQVVFPISGTHFAAFGY
jgi:hypothetical protein